MFGFHETDICRILFIDLVITDGWVMIEWFLDELREIRIRANKIYD
jgi:hypothetical protein